MVITLDLPYHIAQALNAQGDQDLARRALEALAVDEYRRHRLSQKQAGELLGLSRIQTEDLLAQHVDLCDYDPAELAREAELLKNYSER